MIHGDLKGVSHLIFHSRLFSKSDINYINPHDHVGEHSDRQRRPRLPHGFWAYLYHSGGELSRQPSRL
jgi:hypothetical protein